MLEGGFRLNAVFFYFFCFFFFYFFFFFFFFFYFFFGFFFFFYFFLFFVVFFFFFFFFFCVFFFQGRRVFRVPAASGADRLKRSLFWDGTGLWMVLTNVWRKTKVSPGSPIRDGVMTLKQRPQFEAPVRRAGLGAGSVALEARRPAWRQSEFRKLDLRHRPVVRG